MQCRVQYILSDMLHVSDMLSLRCAAQGLTISYMQRGLVHIRVYILTGDDMSCGHWSEWSLFN